MIPTTYNGTAILLLLAEPDWSNPVRAGLEVLSQIESGLTARETRRPFAAALRTVLQFGILATDAEATRLVAGIRAYTTQPVAVPFWPGVTSWADRGTAPFQTKVRLAYKANFSSWALFEEGAEPGWATATDYCAPVLFGRVERHEPRWITPTVCSWDVEFTEQSAAQHALAVAAVEWIAGPSPGSAWDDAPPFLLPFQINHDNPTLGPSVEIIRDRIGYGREPAGTFYPQAPSRGGEAALLETDASVAQLVRFFFDHGAGLPFWAPAWAAAGIMTADLAAGSTTLTVEAGHDIQGGDWLAFQHDGTTTTARATSVTDTSVTLLAAPGAIPKSATLSHLLLARFERPRITVDWVTPSAVRARLAVREVPAEYVPATGETLGETLGKLPTRAWLYEIHEPTADSTTIHRFTSFEQDLEVDGDTYTARPIDHGAIRQGIALDRDEVEVRFAAETTDSTHPLVRLATLRCETPLKLVIRAVSLEFPTA